MLRFLPVVFPGRALPLVLAASCLIGLAKADPPVPPANLLRNNPGFETGGGGGGHGLTGSVPGWEVDYFAYDSFGVAEGEASEGKHRLGLNHGARLSTAAADRADARPGCVYALSFDARRGPDPFPEDRAGLEPAIVFFDAEGRLLKTAREPQLSVDAAEVHPWKTFTLTRVAPPGAAKVGVQILWPRGGWPHEDARTAEVDNFRLVAVPEARDAVVVRRAPRLVERGRAAAVALRYTATAPDVAVAQLVLANRVYGEARAALAPGRGVQELRVPVAANAPESDDYHWQFTLLPAAGGRALDAKALAGVFLDEKIVGGSTADADSPAILYAGRWDRTDAKHPAMFWGGSQIYARFRGTSIRARLSKSGATEYLAVVDGNEEGMTKFKVTEGDGFTVAKGLPDGDHTLVLMRNSETGEPGVFGGFVLDPGKGLLRPEPLPARRIEFYGDSITSGGQPDPLVPNPDPGNDGDYAGNFYRTFAGYTARALGADYRMISKGGTGISGSFVFSYTLLDYYNLWNFDGYRPEAARRWDFKTWQPDAVVVAIGHNDRFRKPSTEAFVKNYAVFVGKLHEAYPKAQIFCTNTAMGGDPIWQAALLPIVAKDPAVHFQLFAPDQGHGGHPRLKDHQAMASGNADWTGLVDWIGETMGW